MTITLGKCRYCDREVRSQSRTRVRKFCDWNCRRAYWDATRQYASPAPARTVEQIPEYAGICWLATSAIDSDGYARIWCEGKNLLLHRVLYSVLRGEIPENHTLDHLCRTRNCVNPWHLEPVSVRINVLRGEGMGARNARKEFAPCGHPYDVVISGGRRCLKCYKADAIVRQARRRGRLKVATG